MIQRLLNTGVQKSEISTNPDLNNHFQGQLNLIYLRWRLNRLRSYLVQLIVDVVKTMYTVYEQKTIKEGMFYYLIAILCLIGEMTIRKVYSDVHKTLLSDKRKWTDVHT